MPPACATPRLRRTTSLAWQRHRVLFALMAWAAWFGCCWAKAAHAGLPDPAQFPLVELSVRSRATIRVPVVAHSDDGVVVLRDGRLHALAWSEVGDRSACMARRSLLVHDRGGWDRVSAEDYFRLGEFEFQRGQRDLAETSFERAVRLDRTCSGRVAEVTKRHGWGREPRELKQEGPFQPEQPPAESKDEAAPSGSDADTLAAQPAAATRAGYDDAYRRFGAEVCRVLGDAVRLVETEHFLIWTDWRDADLPRLREWTEGAFAALAGQLSVPCDTDVFIAKCPMFCFRTRDRFTRFARHFDGYDAIDAVGYTRSNEQLGHVHVVLLLEGWRPIDFDRFACTLVHETTHAFLHRLFSTRLIPHWVNEGYAEWTAERVLPDLCPAAETAALLAREYVRYELPITPFVESSDPIDVADYALAHALVSHLLAKGGERWRDFIARLKAGGSTTDALRDSYDGLTAKQLEAEWRAEVRGRWGS